MFQPSQKLKNEITISEFKIFPESSIPIKYQSIQQTLDSTGIKQMKALLALKTKEIKDKDNKILALQTSNQQIIKKYEMQSRQINTLIKQFQESEEKLQILTQKLTWTIKQLNLRDAELKINGLRKEKGKKLEIVHLVKDFYVPKLNVTQEELQIINQYLTE
ncbi:hypothetical protein SS50377_27472 [Spironucleus salmonicida]|uniref:Uncharacterized protein n=2 Tax=Spironucleus salmonicida TaxID=348837 RepID=A0A9P8RVT7_9EUKA|nr:hypothetical protein SS50377_27472 [Spironucleus salmonicida]